MSNESTTSSIDKAAGATMLLMGFITSALFLVAGSILWSGLLIAIAVESTSVQESGGEMLALGSLILGIFFIIWGFIGLTKSNKALKDALKTEES